MLDLGAVKNIQGNFGKQRHKNVLSALDAIKEIVFDEDNQAPHHKANKSRRRAFYLQGIFFFIFFPLTIIADLRSRSLHQIYNGTEVIRGLLLRSPIDPED